MELLGDREQLDVEDEHARGRAGAARVGELLGDPEAVLGALAHQLYALGPARDDPVEGELVVWPRWTELSNIFPSVVQPV